MIFETPQEVLEYIQDLTDISIEKASNTEYKIIRAIQSYGNFCAQECNDKYQAAIEKAKSETSFKPGIPGVDYFKEEE